MSVARHATVLVNVMIEVRDGSAPQSLSADRARALEALLSTLLPARAPSSGVPPRCTKDHIERQEAAASPGAATGPPLRRLMSALARIASPHAAPAPNAFVDHGSLRVPVTADGAFRTAVHYLERDVVMRHVIERVEHAHTEYTLRIVHNGADRYEPDSRSIVWDPKSALRTTQGGRQSPALGLGHELAHAAERPYRYDADCGVRLRGYDNAEERRVIRGAEAHAARTLGEATRTDHRGTCYRVGSPTTS